jgi:hypothetical protein
MSLTLELPPELEAALTTEAAQAGLPLGDYLSRLISVAHSSGTVRTGADLVAYWKRHGLVGSRSDIEDSQAHARLLRERAERRQG